MATLVLSTLGTVFGGPLGGAVGALVGRQLDGAIIGGPKLEGPRLKDLAVSTSSYGHPIARHYGSVRAAGTIIWASDLKESREKSGGGKGKPSTTTYSYSASFAVALASRPIDGIGRIWADGNLLRGAAGDLKTAGSHRVHCGHADQQPDPLLAAVLGDRCPAHRGCAYVVFEDLALADFGNRIPALTFEIFAGTGAEALAGLLDGIGSVDETAQMPQLLGYSHDTGSIGAVLAQVDRLKPIVPRYDSGALAVAAAQAGTGAIPVLPEPASWSEGEFGREGGQALARGDQRKRAISALRYYDPALDYQPGLQRAEGAQANEDSLTIEFPGVIEAGAARDLLRSASARQGIERETLSWRLAVLDPAIRPGSIVRAPGLPGIWLVAGWEWREAGVELELVRHLGLDSASPASADPGAGWHPPDRSPQPTGLRVFELPWDGNGSSEKMNLYAALTASGDPWPGAALYAKLGSSLEPTGSSGAMRVVGGELSAPLAPSSATRFEAAAQLHLRLYHAGDELRSTDTQGIARGVNRLLVGDEIIQFAQAEPAGEDGWILTGLLRGRGGSELAAQQGHESGAVVSLLDDKLLALDSDDPLVAGSFEFAAIGLAETEPVMAPVENRGASRRPLSPCHGRFERSGDGSLGLSWVRRARGGWSWLDEVEQPLVEQGELYEIGLGDPSMPLALFSTVEPRLTLPSASLLDLESRFPGVAIWVRQSGSFGKSQALFLGTLSPQP